MTNVRYIKDYAIIYLNKKRKFVIKKSLVRVINTLKPHHFILNYYLIRLFLNPYKFHKSESNFIK